VSKKSDGFNIFLRLKPYNFLQSNHNYDKALTKAANHMSIFSEHVLKLLNDYKRLLRRYVTNTEREKTIINLGIKRKSLKFDNDVILYNKAHRVLQDIDYWREKLNRTATEYSGIDEFYEHLKNYLSQYRVEGNAIIHMTQKVSCALVQAIQIISLPASKLSDSSVLKLDDCIQTISKFGNKDQRIMLANALNKQRAQSLNTHLFTPALDSFVKNHCDPFFKLEDQLSPQ